MENRNKQQIETEEYLKKGEELCSGLKEYLELLDKEFHDEKMSPKLQNLAFIGLKISTNKEFAAWLELPREWDASLKDARKVGNLKSVSAFAQEQLEYFQKLLTILKNALTEAGKFFNEPQIVAEADEIIQKRGIPLVKEIITWLEFL